MRESSDNLARNSSPDSSSKSSEKNETELSRQMSSDKVTIDPFASWDTIGTKDLNSDSPKSEPKMCDPWSLPDPFGNSSPAEGVAEGVPEVGGRSENLDTEIPKRKISSSSSSDSSSTKPDGSLEKDIFNTIRQGWKILHFSG